MEVVEKLTLGDTEQILSLISTSYKSFDEDGAYIFTMDGTKVLIQNKGDSLQLLAAFPGNHSMSKANEWNKTTRYTKAYVELDGSIFLQASYNLEGGVRLANIGHWFTIYRACLRNFCQNVV
jgi:hypothetical protein